MKENSGFTLIEILVVLTIFSIIAGFGLVITMGSFQSHNFQSEQNLLIGILQRARSQAMNNIDQTPHGVHITNSNYALFEGVTYVSGINFPVTPGFTASGTSDVIFAQLSGAASSTNVSLTDNATGKIFTIYINNEGQINY